MTPLLTVPIPRSSVFRREAISTPPNSFPSLHFEIKIEIVSIQTLFPPPPTHTRFLFAKDRPVKQPQIGVTIGTPQKHFNDKNFTTREKSFGFRHSKQKMKYSYGFVAKSDAKNFEKLRVGGLGLKVLTLAQVQEHACAACMSQCSASFFQIQGRAMQIL